MVNWGGQNNVNSLKIALKTLLEKLNNSQMSWILLSTDKHTLYPKTQLV